MFDYDFFVSIINFKYSGILGPGVFGAPGIWGLGQHFKICDGFSSLSQTGAYMEMGKIINRGKIRSVTACIFYFEWYIVLKSIQYSIRHEPILIFKGMFLNYVVWQTFYKKELLYFCFIIIFYFTKNNWIIFS